MTVPPHFVPELFVSRMDRIVASPKDHCPFLPRTLLVRQPFHFVSFFVVAHGVAVRPNFARLDGIGCSGARHSSHAQNVLTESLKLFRLDLMLAVYAKQFGDRKCSV